MPTSPRIIHFVWLGKPIPIHYLNSILRCNTKLLAQKTQDRILVILWCDSKMNIYRTASKLDICDIETQLEIKTFKDDLFHRMDSDLFYSINRKAVKRLQQFKLFIRLESNGAHNYATVSDLIRTEVLRQYGGCYCDTDTELVFPKSISEIKREELPNGFKANFSICIALHRFSPLCIGPLRISNDIIVSMPDSKFIRDVLDKTLTTLNKWHKKSLIKYSSPASNSYFSNSDSSISTIGSSSQAKPRSPYDTKRRISSCHEKNKYNKFSLSIKCGPGMVASCLISYIDSKVSEIKSKDSDTLTDQLLPFYKSMSIRSSNIDLKGNLEIITKPETLGKVSISGEIRVFGIDMISNSHMTWIEPEDDGSISSTGRPRSYSL